MSFSFLYLSLSLVSCTPKPKYTSSQNHFQKYFVFGDPKNIIKDATLNPISFVNIENYKSFNGSLINGMMYFEEYEMKSELKARKTLQEKKQEEHSPSSDLQSQNTLILRVSDLRKENSDVFVDFLIESDQKSFPAQYVLTLKKQKNSTLFDFISLSVLMNRKLLVKVPMEVLHYSSRKEDSVFSILASFEDPKGGSTILALYLTAPQFLETSSIQMSQVLTTSPRFRYLLGPGIRSFWQEPIVEVGLCGSKAFLLKENLKQASEEWSHLIQGKVQFHLVEKKVFPPFTDLNEHCLYVFEDYFQEQNEKLMKVASTVTIHSAMKQKILDSDIFFFENELKKDNLDLTPSRLFTNNTRFNIFTYHEFGHFLGLAHKEDEPSIMNYDTSDKLIYDYDREAIQALYGVEPLVSKQKINELSF